MYNEVSASNQRSVRKMALCPGCQQKITRVGKLAKVTKGPAKKIGKEK